MDYGACAWADDSSSVVGDVYDGESSFHGEWCAGGYVLMVYDTVGGISAYERDGSASPSASGACAADDSDVDAVGGSVVWSVETSD